MDDHLQSEDLREYGELYFHSSAVAAILRYVAESLEGDQRDRVLRISSSLPTTMPWLDPSKSLQQQADELALCRAVQLRLQYPALQLDRAIRLTALLRNGPGSQYAVDREHSAGVADEQQDASA